MKQKTMLFLALVLMLDTPTDALSLTANRWQKASEVNRTYYLFGMLDDWMQRYEVLILRSRDKDYQWSLPDTILDHAFKCVSSMGFDQTQNTIWKFINDHPERGEDNVVEIAFDVMRKACPMK